MNPLSDGLQEHHLPQWHRSMLQALDFPAGWKAWRRGPGASLPGGPETVAAWKAQAGQRFQDVVLEPSWPGTGVRDRQLLEARGTYDLYCYTLSLGPDRLNEAWVLQPRGPGPFPAALLLHDHGAKFSIGKEKMIRPPAGQPREAEAQQWVEDNYGGFFWGDALASRGWVVMAIDALGWGERAQGGYEGQQAIASNLANLGTSWAGIIAREDEASLRILASLDGVDPAGEILVFGHSMGGYRALQVGALGSLGPRPVHIAAACCLGTLASTMQPGGNRTRGQSAWTTTHPGLWKHLDFPDLAALHAPGRLSLMHRSEDHLFPPGGLDAAQETLRDIYACAGAPGQFRSRMSPGGHRVDEDDFRYMLEH